jgi:DNA-binding NarL/FixJ family response regulator
VFIGWTRTDRSISPQVVLFDPVPGTLGDLGLRRSIPQLNVIGSVWTPTPEVFLRTVREGIAGYLLKNATAADVAAAVRSVVERRAVCPPTLCRISLVGTDGKKSRSSNSA